MGENSTGRLGWLDLTVDDAEGVRDFYAEVMGWTPDPVDMGEYADFNMVGAGGDPVAGVCHRRGENASQPAGWMPYFVVPELDASVEAVRSRGGELVGEVRRMGETRWCVARDPAGTPFALWEETS